MTDLRQVAHCLILVAALGCSRAPDSSTPAGEATAQLGSITVTRRRWNGTEAPMGDLRFDPQFGAQFITFNVDGNPKKARGYLKNVSGTTIDTFDIFAD